ncbi:MAG: DUF4412 domain-containing protein [Acidobacteriota bacterium]|nr:DUF4412 domain-containing protein [Blastocatellia bacterium]MDW8241087.1 DUF4412 domain-containing protein [Acidobacteriota bacterium]
MLQQRAIDYTPATHLLRTVCLFIVLIMTAAFASACKSDQQTDSGAPSTTSAVTSAVKHAIEGAGEFEGLVEMKLSTPDRAQPMGMTFYLKGERTRMETNMGDVPEAQAVMLMDMAKGEMTTLIPQQKMYVTMNLEEMRKMAEQMGAADQESKEFEFPKLTPTGKTETIAGYQCEHWLMGDQQEIDMCVAKGLGYFGTGSKIGGFGPMKNLMFSPKMLAAAAAHPEWVKFLSGGAFPLKITATEGGKVTMTMEATKIERKKLDDALFTVPADYKKLSMSAMGEQQ